MKHLPTSITLSRILLSIVLLGIHTFSQAFFVIYTYCGVSDIADGFLARKFELSSEKGARIDSIADIVFYGVTAIKIMPSLLSVLSPLIWWIVALVFILRIVSYVVAIIKQHQFVPLHTYINKVTGFSDFVCHSRSNINFCDFK